MRAAAEMVGSMAKGVGFLLRGRGRGVTAIEYLLVAALLVIVFASLRFTLLELLLNIYTFFIEMICSPVL
jgi:hypothetical protein